ncbi:Nif3-like dinuclear metal center hexameric protein [Thiohalomonas denitrificans]|uniref:Dinuclear metal center protein, YbgI/SA1388 family n=1 Tax=Thiohalomonas denitrificans TaxID=415747 RepID=A0A1G5PM49_9GAMM|nr:Nif3-like dinuclear metal center hexameric protein [Thiohalomonas denitrificans]SCZ50532.1 dinuclear metal center protein, YbgI/SA1388 family [Thiohalomonas denitrificans]
MARLSEILTYTDDLLAVDDYQDYCPNGLQVQGREEVNTLVSGVTASRELLEQAAEVGADALLVHHGYFWRGEDPRVIGMKYQRLRCLIDAGISLLAYHLPLDGHSELGNNARLGAMLGLETGGHFGRDHLAHFAVLNTPIASSELARRLETTLDHVPLHIPGAQRQLQRIGWCTGAAQGFLADAAALGLDAFISGEISEPTVHVARELGIDYFAAGHHATERYGVQALGRHLAEQFGVEHRFIDVPNPV